MYRILLYAFQYYVSLSLFASIEFSSIQEKDVCFQGALAGGLASGLFVAWISIGTQLKMAQKIIRFPQKSVSVEGCDANWLDQYMTLSSESEVQSKNSEVPFLLYRVSYMYYTMIGAIVAIVIGLIVSKLTGANKNRAVERDLLSPVIYRFLKYEDKVNLTNHHLNGWKITFHKNSD